MVFFLIKLHFFQKRMLQSNTKEQNVNIEILFVKTTFPQALRLYHLYFAQFSQFYKAFKLFLVKNYRLENRLCEKLGKVFHLVICRCTQDRFWWFLKGPEGFLARSDAFTDKIRPCLEIVFSSFDRVRQRLLYFRFAPNSGFWKEEQHEENVSAEQEEKGQVPWLQGPYVHQGWPQGSCRAQEEAAQAALCLGPLHEGNG